MNIKNSLVEDREIREVFLLHILLQLLQPLLAKVYKKNIKTLKKAITINKEKDLIKATINKRNKDLKQDQGVKIINLQENQGQDQGVKIINNQGDKNQNQIINKEKKII